ncbi:exodeoxyribonuclease V subunit beta [Lysobacter auxotrophicus]|uniref:RecBCD enzyme subunit RecB n=1 Tax=Lysobacter auxotrophicus TaxID=2992573 RepID=A0ABN6UEP0_9GAMM|nr:exodeoxyribonuclease V subunit beta [Lysobacter auxotrophicus]BDU14854.1 exodeoxyribonuclease V subunit beta [Lysobacter auxotrophicus]
MSAVHDAFLDLPLDGVRLIEASAGTGKTFTLATLVTRLVIERGLRVGQILAVTYTEAATQELRERLRLRLELAARLANEVALMPTTLDDDSEAAVTRTLIERQARREDPLALARRLRQAAREMDLAAVFTIHGFCARALAEHAVEAGQPLLAPELTGSERELIDAVATDLWRSLGSDAADAELLQQQWRTPDGLAGDLYKLLYVPRLQPAPPPASPDPLRQLLDAAAALRDAFAAHGEDACAALHAAIENKVLNGTSYKSALIDDLRNALSQWCGNGDASAPVHEKLDRLTPRMLADKTNKPKKGAPLQAPVSPLFDAVARYLDAANARETWLASRRIALVHRVRDAAAKRLAAIKRLRREQTFDDLIANLADALDGPYGARLIERLRAQYAFALVDEFQDTDPRQWSIFERIFGSGDEPALFLIGDPKQAIYRFRGGDVHTYLAAAERAQRAPALDRNFRSRPSVLQAIAALYERAGEAAFVDERIRFRDVEPGGAVQDGDFRRDGNTAPALDLCVLPPPDDGRRNSKWYVGEARQLAALACVTAIHGLLSDAREGRAVLRERGAERTPQSGDIAVLVRNHGEATLMREALSRAGIPAVAAGRRSLFSTEQARDVLALLEALLRPDDDARLRGALATMLVGLDADTLARFDEDAQLHRHWQLRALAWRDRWQRHGPLAMLGDVAAEHAPRLLAQSDGERRLTNTLQLAEVLQEADIEAIGEHGLVDWLRTRIAEADDSDETQQLRLESDARCVQILTLHKSKGLEYPFVFLPFAAIGRDARNGNLCEFHDGEGRVLQLRSEATPENASAWNDARIRHENEERGEDARLLYVGLTRARHALWLATGPFANTELSPLEPMLRDVHALAEVLGNAIAVHRPSLPLRLPDALTPERRDAVPVARETRRAVSRDWWVYSFTQLANESPGTIEAAPRAVAEEGGAQDEPAVVVFDGDPRFGGSRFGNVLHSVLERVDFGAWSHWLDAGMPEGERRHLVDALHGEGYADEDIDDGVDVLAPLVGHTLTVPLPEGARLCDVPVDARLSEMEFHFALESTPVPRLLALLHEHDVLTQRHAFGNRQRLEGLMTGKIDLVYAHDERYFVLDYKSNRLPAYDRASLAAAMDDSEYTLQALLYSLALHRWLRFRLGDAYDYDTHFGGIRYLFCRGLDAARDDSPGVHAWRPARALIDGLDALFRHATHREEAMA